MIPGENVFKKHEIMVAALLDTVRAELRSASQSIQS